MLRISAGVSLCFTLLVVGGGLAACSSDSTKGEGTAGSSSSGGTASTGGSGGKGTVITGGSDDGGGTGGGRAGGTSTGGTGGTAATDCANAPVVCVDAETASTCDPETMMDVSVTCSEYYADLGLVSNGCMGDALSGGCTIDDVMDPACGDGMSAIAACNPDLTEDQLLNVYINCYLDNQGAKEPVTCYGTHVTGNQVDCAAAEADCFGDGAGGDGAGGAAAGGAPG